MWSGIAGGALVLGAGVGIVAIGITAAVIYGFQLADEHQDAIRLGKMIEYLSTKDTFCERVHWPRDEPTKFSSPAP